VIELPYEWVFALTVLAGIGLYHVYVYLEGLAP
jgi:hypothetical protein